MNKFDYQIIRGTKGYNKKQKESGERERTKTGYNKNRKRVQKECVQDEIWQECRPAGGHPLGEILASWCLCERLIKLRYEMENQFLSEWIPSG